MSDENPRAAGAFPPGSRAAGEFALEPAGRTARVTNSGSHQLAAVNLASLG